MDISDIIDLKNELIQCIHKEHNFLNCPFGCGRKSRSRSVILQNISRIKNCKKYVKKEKKEEQKEEAAQDPTPKPEPLKVEKVNKKIVVYFD